MRSMVKWLKELDEDGWLTPIVVLLLWLGAIGYCKFILAIGAAQQAM